MTTAAMARFLSEVLCGCFVAVVAAVAVAVAVAVYIAIAAGPPSQHQEGSTADGGDCCCYC